MSESPLISVKELEAELSDDNLLILDVRASLTDPAEGRRLYDAGHIPGARFTDLENDVSGCARAPTAGIRAGFRALLRQYAASRLKSRKPRGGL